MNFTIIHTCKPDKFIPGQGIRKLRRISFLPLFHATAAVVRVLGELKNLCGSEEEDPGYDQKRGGPFFKSHL